MAGSPTKSPPAGAQEVAPPPLPDLWRKNAYHRQALPVCRTHAVEHNMKRLMALPENVPCQIAQCEHMAAYYNIV